MQIQGWIKKTIGVWSIQAKVLSVPRVCTLIFGKALSTRQHTPVNSLFFFLNKYTYMRHKHLSQSDKAHLSVVYKFTLPIVSIECLQVKQFIYKNNLH